MSSKEGRQDANAVMFNFCFVLFVSLDKNDPRNHINKSMKPRVISVIGLPGKGKLSKSEVVC